MKYKLLKEFPGYPVGYEFEDGTYPMFDAFNKKAYPDFFELIIEKKTLDTITERDKVHMIEGNGDIGWTYNDGWRCRSEKFVTPEEAEDEHKRREWACRKDKYFPGKDELYYYYSATHERVVSTHYMSYSGDILTINLGLAFKTEEECQDAIDNHDLIRLFYTIR